MVNYEIFHGDFTKRDLIGAQESKVAVLVSNYCHNILASNELFQELWGLSHKLMQSRDEMRSLMAVMKKLKNPNAFLSWIMSGYAHPVIATESKLIEFKSGKILKGQLIQGSQKSSKVVWAVEDVSQDNTILVNCRRFNENIFKLTSKERIIFFYYLKGFSSKTIGRMINLSFRTVEKHIDNFHKKLEVHEREKLINLIHYYNFDISELEF